MQFVNALGRYGDAGALDIDIALGAGLVHEDVQNAAQKRALTDDIIFDFLEGCVRSNMGIEHVRQHEALSADGGSDRRRRTDLSGYA